VTLSRNRTLAVIIVLVTAADWIVKAIVQQRLPHRVPQTVVDGWLSLMHTTNHGISWGMMGGSESPWRFPLIVALSLVAIVATASIVRSSRDPWLRLAGALVLGGALGNLGDRLLNGGVTDYIHVHFFPYVFNLADVAITCGGVLLALRMIVDDRRARTSAPAA
jgi:signal peptidase II